MRNFLKVFLAAILLMSFFLVACNRSGEHKVLSESKMQSLMKEVHLLDGYLQNLPSDSSQKIIDTLYAQLLGIYGLDSISFSRNVNYYYKDPIIAEKMYSNIQSDLQGMEKTLAHSDSIRIANERDSMSRQNRYSELLHRIESLQQFEVDSNYVFNYENNNNMLFVGTGIRRPWDNPVGQRPVNRPKVHPRTSTIEQPLEQPSPNEDNERGRSERSKIVGPKARLQSTQPQ